MMSVNDGNDVYAAVWSGTAWSAVDTFETDTGFDLYECYSLAFEGLSGEALAVYAQKDQTQPRYRTYTGGAWSAEANLPSVGVKQRWERLAGDPATDTILFGSLDDGADININVWNGSSWGTNVEMTTAAQTADKRQFDIAFPQNGGTGLVVYVEKDKKTPRYRTWDGSAWSAELTAADLGDKLRVVSLTPGREDGEIFVLVSDDGTDLNFLHWNGTAMSTNTQLEASLGGGSDLTRQFMVVVPTPFWRITSWQEVEP
jgi:hypothetical protein